MRSVGFCGESEPQPSTSNSKKFKSPRKLLDECYAVKHAAIPRKLRSAIKKRGLESMPISKKQNRLYDGVETLRKSGAKKSKLNTKRGHITKDEKEVAEILYFFANTFYDAIKTDEGRFDVHPSETNSSTVLETGSTMTAVQDAGKIATRATVGAFCQTSTSNLEDSTSKSARLKSFDDPQLSKLSISKQYPILSASRDRTDVVTSSRTKMSAPKLPISKQYPILFASGDRTDLVTSSRTKMSALTTVPSDWGITVEQVAAPGIQNFPREDKNNDLLLWRPSLPSTVTQGTETLESYPRTSINKLPAWFETTNHVIQHSTPEESFTENKHHLVKAEPMRLRKRCSAHIYICHLIKVMQVSDRKEGLPGTRFEPGPHINIEHQKNGIDTSDALSSTISSIQDTILLHENLFQDPQQASKMPASCSPLKQGSDFLSLAGHSDEVLKQFHSSYIQSQNNLTKLLSQPQNCYSTFHDRSAAVATEQLPPFHSSRVAALFAAQSTPAGLPTSHVPERKNGERDPPFFVNCAQARPLFPHLHSLPGLNYQQFPQQQFNTIYLPPSLSNAKGNSLRLPSGFDRNRATCYPGNTSQLQIFCNQQRL